MTAAENIPSIESPCIKICAIHHASGLCVGCGRNLAEIESWLRYSSAERARVMGELPQRLAELRRLDAGEAT